MSTLTKAHMQWANRPADETFPSIEALHNACYRWREESVYASVAMNDIRVEADGDDVRLVGKQEKPALLTAWSFNQLAQRAGAPAGYLRGLPATLAAQNLNYGLAHADREGGNTQLLFRQNGEFRLQAALSDSYTRIWNSDITSRLLQLQEDQPSWKLPLAYDRHGGTVEARSMHTMTDLRTGAAMVPRGAYASDRDMFAFLVDEDHTINLPGSDHPLKRGFFVWNSEVGSATFGVTTFLYDYVCGNHYVWGAQNVKEVRVRHVGSADKLGWYKVSGSIHEFANASAREDEVRIEAARTKLLGSKREDVIEMVAAKRMPELSKKRIALAYDVAEATPRYGDPRSVWGLVSGLTEIAQEAKNTDDRTQIDRAAGKLLEIAF